MGRLSNPPGIAETAVLEGSEPIDRSGEVVEIARTEDSENPAARRREETGRLSIPPQRRLSPTDIDDLIEADQAGATINQLADEFGIHRTPVTGHLDPHGVPRDSEHTACDDRTLKEAAELYAAGRSLAEVGEQFGIDAQTVANRIRRAGVAVRPRRGWTSRDHSVHERR